MRRKQNKNAIQNVRVVDKDEGSDDIICQRLLSAYVTSEGQTRVVLGYRGEISNYVAGTPITGTVGFTEASATDDFASFITQYREFRIRAIRYDIYDIQPNSSVVNYWSTYHTISGTVATDAESVMDRPDARSVSPGDGKVSLAWVAHSIPEMAFQNVSSFNGLGGLSYYTVSGTAVGNSKYTIMAKYIVDFRGRQ